MTFMQEFRPRPATTTLHDALAMELDQLDRRIKTSNNIPSKTLAEHVMVLLLGMHQWIAAQGQDLADYSQAIAASVDGSIEPASLGDDDIELLGAIHDHLEEIKKLFDEMKAVLPENVVKLGERNNELLAALDELIEEQEVGGEGETEEGDEGDLFETDGDDEARDVTDAEVAK